MTDSKISIAPSPGMILAEIAREGMDWEKALGEPIDNSLDANATRITITIDRRAKRVRIDDNGDGCPEPHRILVSGYTTKRGSKNTLGRYGVGLKHASYYFCGENGTTSIVTKHGSECRSVSVVWSDVVESGSWDIDAPTVVDPDAVAQILGESCGTSIMFSNVRRGWLSSDQLDSVMSKLSFVFSPALRSGRQVEFCVNGKRKTLSAPRDPAWSESVEFNVSIDHRTVSVRAGILAVNDKSGRRGMSFCYGHRIIVADTTDGCGDYSTIGFAGIVELDEHWRLGQNKSQIVDEAWPRLCGQIEERVRPLLEKLKNSTQHLKSEAIRNAAATFLNALVTDGKGEAKRPGKRGSERKKKRNVDRTVRESSLVDGVGSVLGKRRSGGSITIDWHDDPEMEEAARVDPNGTRVYMNRCKYVIRDAVERGDMTLLAVIAAAHLFHDATRSKLWGEAEFGVAMGKLLSTNLSNSLSTQEPKPGTFAGN